MLRHLKHRLRSFGLSYLLPMARSVRQETYPTEPEYFWQHWWANAEAVDDQHSIERDGADDLPARIHYRATEAAILTACYRYDIDPSGGAVLDVGTGAGHWLGFWRQFDPAVVYGVDVAAAAVDALREEYENDEEVYVSQADLAEGLPFADGTIDLVSGVGVMFHLTHDEQFQAALEELARVLADDGVALLTGKAGWLSYDRGIQRREDSQPPEVFKRLRSKREWRSRCRAAGLEVVDVLETPGFVDVNQPEANVLVIRPR